MELAIPSVDGDWRACTAATDSTNKTPATLQKPLRTRVATALSINTPFRNCGLTRNFKPQCDATVFKMKACLVTQGAGADFHPSPPRARAWVRLVDAARRPAPVHRRSSGDSGLREKGRLCLEMSHCARGAAGRSW